jgi:serine/threonine protein kinase
MQPEQFGPYVLHGLLGRGGMGEVHRAYDTVRERNVALKRLLSIHAGDESFRARFFRECHGAAQLSEPHVVPIHDYGEIDGSLYLDMRLIEGRDLARLLADDGAMAAPVAVDIVTQVAAALDAAHDIGLVHRDVKPSNVIVDESGPTPHCYLVDFGVASSLRSSTTSSLTSTGAIAGTLDYVAPERLRRGPTDHRVDVYSLACLLHELLTGRPPFPRGDIAAMCSAHLFDEPPAPSTVHSDVPSALDDVVARGMAKDPLARFDSAGALAAAARSALVGAASPSMAPAPSTVIKPIPPATAPSPAATAARSPRIGPHHRKLVVRLTVVGALLLAAGLGGLVMTLLRPGVTAVAEAAGVPGKHPFMSPSGSSRAPQTSTHSTSPASNSEVGRPSVVTGSTDVSGNTPGLYGGTQEDRCDPKQLVDFLRAHPDRGAAWAKAQGIPRDTIADFVTGLTPVVLRTDTAVTNNGFSAGKATPFQAILQAGTAVLVDSVGVPRARCACGNPMTRPASDVSLDLPQTPWPGYQADHVVVVQPAKRPVDTFVLVRLDKKPTDSAVITRPRGTTKMDPASPTDTKTALEFGSAPPAPTSASTGSSSGADGAPAGSTTTAGASSPNAGTSTGPTSAAGDTSGDPIDSSSVTSTTATTDAGSSTSEDSPSSSDTSSDSSTTPAPTTTESTATTTESTPTTTESAPTSDSGSTTSTAESPVSTSAETDSPPPSDVSTDSSAPSS